MTGASSLCPSIAWLTCVLSASTLPSPFPPMCGAEEWASWPSMEVSPSASPGLLTKAEWLRSSLVWEDTPESPGETGREGIGPVQGKPLESEAKHPRDCKWFGVVRGEVASVCGDCLSFPFPSSSSNHRYFSFQKSQLCGRSHLQFRQSPPAPWAPRRIES